MGHASNCCLSTLNFLTILLSIPIIGTGVWLAERSQTDCEKFLQGPIISVGVFLLAISLAGLIGSCFRITCLLWFYLFVMFLLIVLLFCFTVFAFVVTNRGAGKVLSNRGYMEYKLGDYSNWLQKRVGNDKNWNHIKSCLIQGQICKTMSLTYAPSLADLQSERLSALQSGCCKPDDNCNFSYKSPTEWMKTEVETNSTIPDCALWDNNNSTLCFNCGSCKAAFIDNIKQDWKRVAVSNIIVLIFLVLVYSIGCCAFRNNRADNYYPHYKGYP